VDTADDVRTHMEIAFLDRSNLFASGKWDENELERIAVGKIDGKYTLPDRKASLEWLINHLEHGTTPIDQAPVLLPSH